MGYHFLANSQTVSHDLVEHDSFNLSAGPELLILDTEKTKHLGSSWSGIGKKQSLKSSTNIGVFTGMVETRESPR